ncbi:MAG: Gfo/Idh/MocA family oxidoreductase [Bacteroidia bacterium]|nr:Gfo/Idh/MocA family oxidoreductase [Bacteroidia bacterium]
MMKTLSRREASKKIALGLGAMAGISSLPVLGRPLNEKKLGVALVGLGNYSNILLGPAFADTQNCYLAGIVTGTPAKATEWSARYNIPPQNIYNYETFDRIADNPDIDIVYIVLPNFLHAEYTIRAAKAGKHVICEKPMALNVRECEAMIEACDKAGKLLSIGYRLHFEPHHKEVMRLGKEKPYGPINLIESSLGYHLSDPTLWRLDKKKGGGGAIMDLGVYAIQGARYVVGEEPVSVTAQGIRRDFTRFRDIYETIFWQMNFPGGEVANCSTSYSSYVDRLYVSCYHGWFGLKPSYGGNGTEGETSDGPMSFPAINQQAAQMDGFVECIRENRRSAISGEEGLRDLRVIEAVLKSADTGKKIRL